MKKIELAVDNGNRMKLFQLHNDKMQKARICNMNNIENIGIYYVDTEEQIDENIGNVIWPSEIEKRDISIFFNPVTQNGEIRIEETDYIWSFDTKDVSKEQKKRGDRIHREEVLKELEKKEKVVFYADDLAEELKKDIYGQDKEIQMASEIIVSMKNKKTPGLITILLMGPNGIGKTQFGKELAPAMTRLTKEEWGLQNISMNEFKESHAISRIIGTTAGYVGFGGKTMFEPSRNGKPQIYVLNEFEKTNPEVVDGMMEIFSEGKVQLGDNTEIDLRGNTIIIMTTNLPIDLEEYNKATPFIKKEMCRDVLANHFGRPELAGKITHALAFQMLSDDAIFDIIEKFVEEILSDYDIEVDYIDSPLAVELLQMMKTTKYGARGIKDAIQTALTHYTAYKGKMDHLAGKRVGMYGDIDCIRLEPCT